MIKVPVKFSRKFYIRKANVIEHFKKWLGRPTSPTEMHSAEVVVSLRGKYHMARFIPKTPILLQPGESYWAVYQLKKDMDMIWFECRIEK